MKRLLCLAIACAMTVPASAITVDGTLDGAYGPALAVQTNNTSFGNNQSELNAAYGVFDSGKLNLMLTGNLENNFNKLSIFIDSKAGGQSVFNSAGNDGANNMDGLTFGSGFTANYHIIVRRGLGIFDLDFADLDASSFTYHADVFGGGEVGSGVTGTGVNASPIEVAYDDSNTGGVGDFFGAGPGDGTGLADQSAALAVTTGLELAIDLSDLGYAGGPIHVLALVNNNDHSFASNQFLPGLPVGYSHMGNIQGLDLSNSNEYPNDMFFTVIPEPSSLGLMALAMAGFLCGRRRRPVSA